MRRLYRLNREIELPVPTSSPRDIADQKHPRGASAGRGSPSPTSERIQLRHQAQSPTTAAVLHRRSTYVRDDQPGPRYRHANDVRPDAGNAVAPLNHQHKRAISRNACVEPACDTRCASSNVRWTTCQQVPTAASSAWLSSPRPVTSQSGLRSSRTARPSLRLRFHSRRRPST